MLLKKGRSMSKASKAGRKYNALTRIRPSASHKRSNDDPPRIGYARNAIWNKAILAVPARIRPDCFGQDDRTCSGGRQMPLRFSSEELVLPVTKSTIGRSRKGTRRVAPWTAGTCHRFSMRSLLSRISGGLATFIEADVRSIMEKEHGSASFASGKR